MTRHESLRAELSRIAAFGVELRSVEEQDLPMLCHWRNKPEILPFMGDVRPVTPQVMRFWLGRVQSGDTVWPYIGCWDGTPVGYIEIKDIDWSNSSCTSGIFLSGKENFSTGVSFCLVLCREIVLARLGLKLLISKIRPNNVRSIRFCTAYGAEYVRTDGEFLVYHYEFSRRRQKLKTIAAALGMKDEFARHFEEGQT
ncbi:GNAT family N-acetyltransferase [uncultured Mailhella sp.]|uniref:GNAT family N-acetyltransferase n=1 Tax=uncultured Mailhella sp. TaxID=1981031 RepID=UPI0026047828|nr:GNAT family N-acetyltransferase [uncultured Mailhella sp.]